MRNKSYLTGASLLLSVAISSGLVGCATEHSQSLAVQKTRAAEKSFSGVRVPMAIGKVGNHSSFMRGIFSDGTDSLGSQTKAILISHLQQTNRFNMLDRSNLEETKQETDFKKSDQSIKGADYIITGAVTEFGRKEVGDQQLFGILGRGKSQVAYAKVSLNIVDTRTSEVVYATQGAGEYELSNREVVGFGGTAGYDSTLNGKVLDLAVREAVDHLVYAMDSGDWRPRH